MYQKILVPVDGSETSARGLEEALRLARELKSSLHLLNVIDEYPLMVEMSSVVNAEDLRQSMRQYAQGVLGKARQLAADRGVEADAHLAEITSGRVASVILTQARELGCDLIVMGTHGRRGLSRSLLGSDAELVLRSSGVPVLLVRQPEGVP
jgi:nucleotide-binding universal stress UspA family protein